MSRCAAVRPTRQPWLTPTARIGLITLAACGAWMALAWGLVPALLPLLGGVGGPMRKVVEELREHWPVLAHAGATGCLLMGGLLMLVSRPAFFERVVGPASAEALAAIRVVVCGVLLLDLAAEFLPATAVLPASMSNPVGLMRLLYALPIGFERLLGHPMALWALQALTEALLVCALLGWRARWTVPAAAVSYLIVGGILRQYSWCYHQGLVPAYVLLVLACSPCADAWSLDRRRALAAGRPVPDPRQPRASYGWARYACWVVIALPYVAAGLSKLRLGGWDWWRPDNMRAIVMEDALNLMEFQSPLGVALAAAPDWVFGLLGASAMLSEISFGAVLGSRRARRWLPAVMASMHVGIALLQNVLFLDLILIQSVFFDLPAWARRIAGGASAVAATTRRRIGSSRETPRTAGAWPAAVAGVMALLAVCWIDRVEMYPLTAMQMYTRSRGNIIAYHKAAVRTADGTWSQPGFKRMAAVLRRNGRYRRIIRSCFWTETRGDCQAFLTATAAAYNRRVPAAARITEVAVERWAMNVADRSPEPSRRYGRPIDQVVVTVTDQAPGLLAASVPFESVMPETAGDQPVDNDSN